MSNPEANFRDKFARSIMIGWAPGMSNFVCSKRKPGWSVTMGKMKWTYKVFEIYDDIKFDLTLIAEKVTEGMSLNK